MPEVRSFARHDRHGLTSLANRHIASAVPGAAVPTAALLSQMEYDAGEYIVEPWVVDRRTFVGLESDRLVAAVHVKRYATDARATDSYRNAAGIDWFVFDPAFTQTAAAVLNEAVTHLRGWGARIWYADGNLPCLGVYGIPDSWPHVQAMIAETGFDDRDGQVEIIFAGDLDDVPAPGDPPIAGLELRRVVGPLGTSFEAWRDGTRVGVFEVEDSHGTANMQLAGWADESNHWVAPDHRSHGIGSWLFRHGCAWLRLGGKERLLTYAIESSTSNEPTADRARRYYARFGLQPISRTRRGWQRLPA